MYLPVKQAAAQISGLAHSRNEGQVPKLSRRLDDDPVACR